MRRVTASGPRLHRWFKQLFCAVPLAMLMLAVRTAAAQSAFLFPGSTPVASSTTETVGVGIATSGHISQVLVLTGGLPALDFTSSSNGTCTAGSRVSAGASCVLPVSFKPTAPGGRLGAVVVLDSSGAVLASQPLYGMATGPLSVFVPATIDTVAGNGQWLYKTGDDGVAATTSPLFLPAGVAVDPAGNLFIADSSNNRIRRVDAGTGIISSIAGDGTPGFANDGKPAITAEVSNPGNILLDGAGNLYIADSGNHAVRKLVLATGVLTTVAGQLGAAGSTGDGGPAIAALLNSPEGLALDAAGNLYIADTGNNVVRKVDASTQVITTYAGTMGEAGLSGDGGLAVSALLNTPWGLATDSTGNLYIADLNNSRVREVMSNGAIKTIAGTASTNTSSAGLPATSTNLKNAAAVAVDVAGNIYIADSGHALVLKISASTGLVSFSAGSGSQTFGGDLGPANKAGLYGPYALTLDSAGNLYIADIFHNRVREVLNSQATLSYSAIHVGSTSASQDQVLEDDGNAALEGLSLTPDTNSLLDTADSTCSTGVPVAENDTCTLAVEFHPQVIGNPVKAVVQLGSNAVNTPGVLTLSGQSTALTSTTTALISSLNPSALGGPVTFTATVTGSKPTGTVEFFDGSTSIGSGTLDSSIGVATLSTSALALGSHLITTTYDGDAANLPSTSGSLTQVVTQAAIVTLTSSVNPTTVGASTTLAATVSAGGSPASGSVMFEDGTAILGTVSLNANGTATLPVSTLSTGTHSIVAAYEGNATTSAANSIPLTQTVNLWPSDVRLGTSITPSLLGQSVSFTIAVTSGSSVEPTGTVTLLDGSTPLATLSLSSSVATYSSLTLTVGTHSLSASYSGDTANAASTSKSLTQSVNKISTTSTLNSSLNPSNAGAAIELTAVVTAAATNGVAGALAGTVTFTEGTNTLGTSTLYSAGTASITLSNLSVGSHAIVANYLGNNGYAASSSSALIQVVKVAATSVALTSSNSPSIVGNNVLFTAIVTGNGGVPTGTITFLDGTTVLGRNALNSAGQATLSTSGLIVGTHTITASYSGDSADASSVSSAFSQVVQQTKTAITLVSSSNPGLAGTTISLAATISSNGDIPSGQLQLMEGTTPLATSAISGTGGAQFTLNSLTPGSHLLTASFAGDANDSAATSATLVEVIQLASASLSLSSNGDPTIVGSPVVLTAKVTGTGNQPTGTVTFLDGSSALGTATITSGAATLSTSNLALGTHTITASYGGDSGHSSASSSFSQVVQQAKTAITLVSSSDPGVSGTSIKFAATISGSGGIPTGQLQLLEGATVLATSPISASGGAQFTVSALATGSHTLIASFAGDAKDAASTSAPLTEVIQLAGSTLSLSSNADPSTVGSPVVFTARVAGAGNQPTGVVTFLDGSSTLGTATIASGAAILSTSSLALGTHNITASYGGDAGHSPATAATLSQQIQQTSVTTLTSSANPLVVGASVTIRASVTGLTSSPTGTVTFYDGSTALGSATLTSGVASFTTANLSAGPHLLIARYQGDANTLASDSASLTQVVNAAGTTTSLSSSANPSSTGSPVVLTAKVTSTGDQPTGSVSFTEGSTTLGTAAVVNGMATLSLSSLATGQHAIVAQYAGDAMTQGSTSAILVQVIQQHTTIALTTGANPILTAQGLTLTATVTGASATGTVTFSDGSAVLAQANLSAGTAVLTLSSLSAGTHSLSASYGGDSYDFASTSSSVLETVDLRPSSTSLTSSSSTYLSGDQITLVAIVQTSGPVAPTGSVTFSAGGVTLGSASVNGAGAAAYTFIPSSASYTITASYSGDGVYLPSTAAAYTLQEGASSTFDLSITPQTVSLASGDHTTLSLNLSSPVQFADTMSLACLDLPADATCTFSANQVKLSAAGTASAQIVLDTGLPLGAGPSANSAALRRERSVEMAATMLPAGLLLLFPLLGRRRRFVPLLLLALLLTGLGVSGCGSSLNVSSTPAGTYHIRVLATGNTTGLTQTANITLTVR